MVKYKCVKTLKMEDGSICFIKNKTYKCTSDEDDDKFLCLIDEEDEEHGINGTWLPYFEKVVNNDKL